VSFFFALFAVNAMSDRDREDCCYVTQRDRGDPHATARVLPGDADLRRRYQWALLFYNEPAEAILGCRFDETGEMPESEWRRIFVAMDEQGVPLPPGALPLAVAVHENRPIHSTFWIRGLDAALRHIEATAFPLIGQAGRDLGAVAIFWEIGG
jgi:PAS domain-containing protein